MLEAGLCLCELSDMQWKMRSTKGPYGFSGRGIFGGGLGGLGSLFTRLVIDVES